MTDRKFAATLRTRLVLGGAAGLAAASLVFATQANLAAGPYTIVAAPNHTPSAFDAGSPGFDSAGIAYIRDGARLAVIKPGGAAQTLDFGSAMQLAINRDIFGANGKWDGAWDKSKMVDDAIVFDRQDRAYTLIIPRYSNLKTAVLLTSTDHAKTWTAVALQSRNATLERPDSFNDRNGPPTILSYENYGSYTGPHLWLETFKIADGTLHPAFPALPVADDSLLVANHSGGGNSTFTTPESIFVVYDSLDKSAPGTLSLAREFDRATGTWKSASKPIGRSSTAIAPDNHDMPAITMDAQHYLTVVIGAHHALFKVVKSAKPNTMTAGWQSQTILGGGPQGADAASYSYVSLNTSRSGVVNIIARAEGSSHYELVQFRRNKDGIWAKPPDGLPHTVIATPSRTAYVAWRQQVTTDPAGKMYLNFAYYANRLTAPEAQRAGVMQENPKQCSQERCWYMTAPTAPGVTLTSTNDGKTWQ